MMHKIRLSMGNRDDAYRLTDMIELDDAYIETCTDSADKQQLRRGKKQPTANQNNGNGGACFVGRCAARKDHSPMPLL
jgi:hypothetical protein